MNNKKHFLKNGKTGFALTTGLLIAVTGCFSHADGQSIRFSIPAPVVVVSPPAVVVSPPAVVVAPPVVAVAPAVVVGEDDYVYYPSYGVYYNTSRHQYAYMDGGAWVSRPAPIGVSADVLLASPSVRMDFHDSPANHHADMARRYPKSYQAGRSEPKADGRDDHREEHR
jgi:hypothetical protein